MQIASLLVSLCLPVYRIQKKRKGVLLILKSQILVLSAWGPGPGGFEVTSKRSAGACAFVGFLKSWNLAHTHQTRTANWIWIFLFFWFWRIFPPREHFPGPPLNYRAELRVRESEETYSSTIRTNDESSEEPLSWRLLSFVDTTGTGAGAGSGSSKLKLFLWFSFVDTRGVAAISKKTDSRDDWSTK